MSDTKYLLPPTPAASIPVSGKPAVSKPRLVLPNRRLLAELRAGFDGPSAVPAPTTAAGRKFIAERKKADDKQKQTARDILYDRSHPIRIKMEAYEAYVLSRLKIASRRAKLHANRRLAELRAYKGTDPEERRILLARRRFAKRWAHTQAQMFKAQQLTVKYGLDLPKIERTFTAFVGNGGVSVTRAAPESDSDEEDNNAGGDPELVKYWDNLRRYCAHAVPLAKKAAAEMRMHIIDTALEIFRVFGPCKPFIGVTVVKDTVFAIEGPSGDPGRALSPAEFSLYRKALALRVKLLSRPSEARTRPGKEPQSIEQYIIIDDREKPGVAYYSAHRLLRANAADLDEERKSAESKDFELGRANEWHWNHRTTFVRLVLARCQLCFPVRGLRAWSTDIILSYSAVQFHASDVWLWSDTDSVTDSEYHRLIRAEQKDMAEFVPKAAEICRRFPAARFDVEQYLYHTLAIAEDVETEKVTRALARCLGDEPFSVDQLRNSAFCAGVAAAQRFGRRVLTRIEEHTMAIQNELTAAGQKVGMPRAFHLKTGPLELIADGDADADAKAAVAYASGNSAAMYVAKARSAEETKHLAAICMHSEEYLSLGNALLDLRVSSSEASASLDSKVACAGLTRFQLRLLGQLIPSVELALLSTFAEYRGASSAARGVTPKDKDAGIDFYSDLSYTLQEARAAREDAAADCAASTDEADDSAAKEVSTDDADRARDWSEADHARIAHSVMEEQDQRRALAAVAATVRLV